MNSYIKISIIATLLSGGFACTDLDEEIKDNYTENFDPENKGLGIPTNVNKPTPPDGLGGAFSQLLNGTAQHGGYFSIQEVSSDEAVITQKGGDWFDGGIWLNMHKHNFTSTNDGFNGAWTATYGGIFQCNDLLKNGGLKAPEIAQLRVLRAYFYWRLIDTFGNVKVVTEPGVDAPQKTRAEVFDFIESELLEALPDLKETRQDYGRVNQSGAYALLARLYLNAEVYKGSPEYQKAIDMADSVINSGIYELDENYADVFSPSNVDMKEHIFVVPFDQSTGQGFQLAQMTLHYPSQLTYRLKEQPWNGYSTLEEFYNSYEDGDDRKANNFIVGPQVDMEGNPILDVAYDKADPDGAPINYTPEINELAPNGSRQAGARLGKFSFKNYQLQHMDNDYPLLRYGEVLLNKAEALARLNDNWNDPDALELVNQLRERAGVDKFGSMTEGTMLAERGRELFIEGLRRSDLIRFGAWGSAWWEKPAHNNPNFNLFPIPQAQINASQSETYKLTQNPGY